MNKELIEALDILEKEKNISKETLLEAIENSLLTACKNHFGKADNVKVTINAVTGDFSVIAEKEVVEQPEDDMLQIRRKQERSRPTAGWATLSRCRSNQRNLAVSPHRTQRT